VLLANKLIAGGVGLAAVLLRRAATIELDWDTRQKSRFDAVDSQGRHIGVFLPRGIVVRGGDVLVAEDGSLVAVKARPQAVLVVTAPGSPLTLLRAAYHLGNRHVPLEVKADRLQLEPDHVLAEMLRRMGLAVAEAEVAFEPEAGAYDASSMPPGHDHLHGHDHAHADEHEHAHAHDHGHAHEGEHEHKHDASCGHDHGHGPAHDHEHR
jgi:urease accessory protein